MELVLTAKVKLSPILEESILLDNTLVAVRNGLNYTSKIAFANNKLSAFKKLQKLVYTDLRDEYELKSQMVCNVCSAVAGTYASMKSNKESTLVLYKKPKLQYSFNRDYGFLKGKDGIVSIATLNDRIKNPFVKTGLEHYFDGTWEYGTGTLVKKKDKYYLHISVKKKINICSNDNITKVVGVNVGMNYLITAADNDNKMLFVNERDIKNKKAQFQRARKTLQSTQTPSSRRRLKKIGNRSLRKPLAI